jgi:small subunit ribosomal protein S15
MRLISFDDFIRLIPPNQLVIALTTRIQQLQTHMVQHKKDKHSKRGLDALYVRRRKLLDYMERTAFDSYRKVVKTLGLIR